VAFRGRAFECDCEKWLCSAGSKVVLWGIENVGEGDTVIVAESPIDAALAMQETPEIVAVASTGGAGTWRGVWSLRLARLRPARVIVWYDNDLAGTPSPTIRKELAQEWRKKNPKAKRLPRANGPWVANSLLKVRVPAMLYQWPAEAPAKADLSTVLMKG